MMMMMIMTTAAGPGRVVKVEGKINVAKYREILTDLNLCLQPNYYLEKYLSSKQKMTWIIQGKPHRNVNKTFML